MKCRKSHFGHGQPNNLHWAEAEDAISADSSPCVLARVQKLDKQVLLKSVSENVPRCLSTNAVSKLWN